MKRILVLGVFILSAVVVGSSFFNNVSAEKRSSKSDDGRQASPLLSPIRVEDFSYAVGTLTDVGGANVSGGNWVSNTGTGNFLTVSAGSLSYAGYPSSGIGNKLDIVSTAASAEDAFRNFPTQTSGTTYAAFMVNVANTTGLALNTSATGDYFAGFTSSTSTTAFVDRVTIRSGSVANTYQLGFRATGNAGNAQVFNTTDLPVGTTALVVISYQLVAGATNDVCNMWINPVITSPEPAPTLTQVSASDNGDTGRFFVRQGNAGTPNASIDGVRVGTTWDSLVQTFVPPFSVVDFNGDGKTDYSVIRNTGGGSGGAVTWFNQINGGSASAATWGIATDFFVPGDFDGDGKTDLSVWRSGTTSTWYVLRSSDNTADVNVFGQPNDDPTVAGDYDGDGKDDIAVYRGGATAGAASHWWYRRSSVGGAGCTASNCNDVTFGQNGDFPAPGDYDGDGKNDFVVQRNDGGGVARFWELFATGTENHATLFGTPTDTIVPGDYDGDGKTDVATARASGGAIIWNIHFSSTGLDTVITWGTSATDEICQGDYDGDGKTDVAIWRAGTFWVRGSTGGATGVTWGLVGDSPVANFNTH